MDFNIGNLWSSLMISCIGMAFVMYGKKAARLWPLVAGLAMCIYPYMITDWRVLWGVTVGVMAFLYMMREQ